MKKPLVLLGEGHGELSALPVLVRKVLHEKKGGDLLFVDQEVIRTSRSSLIRWDKKTNKTDFSVWLKRVELARRKSKNGAVLAIYDGDFPDFPLGSAFPFCASQAAKVMAAEAANVGAGKLFSLSIVFARSEYETWLVAGVESLAGRSLKDGLPGLPAHLTFPVGDPESHGKRWLEKYYPNYRPPIHQSALTELLDLNCVRAKGLRSFARLEHAVDQLLEAAAKGDHVSTPC